MISLTMDEAKEVYRFLETLQTCEYKGAAPTFDDDTADDLATIGSVIYSHIVAEGGNPYA